MNPDIVESLIEQERFLTYQITKLVFEGGAGNFLIVSQGPYYVQLMGERGAKQIIAESVGNEYLSPEIRISSEKVNKLNENGFSLQDPADLNYQRVCSLSRPEHFHQLAHFLLSLMIDIYGCQVSKGWEMKLTLE